MTNEELQQIIDNIVADSFKRLEYAYQYHREPKEDSHDNITLIEKSPLSRLVFSRYSKNGEINGDTRISEQELRFAFVEAFNAYCEKNKTELYYSIETPTAKKYLDFSTEPRPDNDGRSGEFDMVIFDKELKRVCLIEFKANNADDIDHEKDLLKLKEEGTGILCYFIEVIKTYTTGNDKTKTIGSLKRKFKLNNEDGKTMIRCYALEGQSRKEAKGEDISYMFNMSNLHHEDTGIDAVIWVSHKWLECEPFILAKTSMGKVSISIGDNPDVLEFYKLSDGDDISDVIEWIRLNKKVLLEYWNDIMYPTSKLLNEIKKLKSEKEQ